MPRPYLRLLRETDPFWRQFEMADPVHWQMLWDAVARAEWKRMQREQAEEVAHAAEVAASTSEPQTRTA